MLFESGEANAFCLPGGKVGVYTGLLPITQNEAGLATVLAHEVAHAVAHHGSERISRVLAIQGLGIAMISQINQLNSNTRNLLYAAYGLGTTLGTPSRRMLMAEFVVPRSIPTVAPGCSCNGTTAGSTMRSSSGRSRT